MELMVVMVIVLLIGALGYDYMRGQLKKMRLINTANEITAVIQRARQTAIRRTRPVEVVPEIVAVAVTPPADSIVEVIEARTKRTYLVTNLINHDLTKTEIDRYQFTQDDGGVLFQGPPGSLGDYSTFPGAGGALEIKSDGTVEATGGFRIADASDNLLEVAVKDTGGSLELRKWLKVADRPPGLREFFPEVTARTAGEKNNWIWY